MMYWCVDLTKLKFVVMGNVRTGSPAEEQDWQSSGLIEQGNQTWFGKWKDVVCRAGLPGLKMKNSRWGERLFGLSTNQGYGLSLIIKDTRQEVKPLPHPYLGRIAPVAGTDVQLFIKHC
jgi:hypothetical protein